MNRLLLLCLVVAILSSEVHAVSLNFTRSFHFWLWEFTWHVQSVELKHKRHADSVSRLGSCCLKQQKRADLGVWTVGVSAPEGFSRKDLGNEHFQWDYWCCNFKSLNWDSHIFAFAKQINRNRIKIWAYGMLFLTPDWEVGPWPLQAGWCWVWALWV